MRLRRFPVRRAGSALGRLDVEELDARRTDQVLAPLVEEPPDVLLSLVLLECGGIPVEFVEHARSGRSLDQVTGVDEGLGLLGLDQRKGLVNQFVEALFGARLQIEANANRERHNSSLPPTGAVDDVAAGGLKAVIKCGASLTYASASIFVLSDTNATSSTGSPCSASQWAVSLSPGTTTCEFHGRARRCSVGFGASIALSRASIDRYPGPSTKAAN